LRVICELECNRSARRHTLPARLIGDKAYESERLDRDLSDRIQLITPHRGERPKPAQDVRPLRHYRRRWRVERLFAWLHHFRRLVIGWEYHVENFCGMVRLGVYANLVQIFISDYSYRNANIGSMRTARRAGA